MKILALILARTSCPSFSAELLALILGKP